MRASFGLRRAHWRQFSHPGFAPIQESGAMTSAQLVVPALAAAGAIPSGFAAALAARRLADAIEPPVWIMIVLSVGLAVWAALVMPHGALLWITFVLGWALLVLATVDAIAFRLPDAITLPLIALGIG